MPKPLISLVSAAYNVERYVAEFLDSVAAQSLPLHYIEVIIVNDGSTDGTRQAIEEWQQRNNNSRGRNSSDRNSRGRNSLKVRLINQENQGVAAARNRGVAEATGEWLSFVDPDDTIDPAYFQALLRAAYSPAAKGVNLIAGRIYARTDDGGQLGAEHSLEWRFKGLTGPFLVDLTKSPRIIQLSASSALLRRSAFPAEGFNPAIRPSFEDAELISRYVAQDPRMLLVPGARYYYRRGRGDSLTTSSWQKADRFTTIFEEGYQRVLDQHEGLPTAGWARQMVLYDFGWYDAVLRKNPKLIAEISPEVEAGFIVAARKLLRRLDPQECHWRHFPLERAQLWHEWALGDSQAILAKLISNELVGTPVDTSTVGRLAARNLWPLIVWLARRR